jgi:hypothetical protein
MRLATGCWPLATGFCYYLLLAGHWLLITGSWSPVTMVTGSFLLVSGSASSKKPAASGKIATFVTFYGTQHYE